MCFLLSAHILRDRDRIWIVVAYDFKSIWIGREMMIRVTCCCDHPIYIQTRIIIIAPISHDLISFHELTIIFPDFGFQSNLVDAYDMILWTMMIDDDPITFSVFGFR